VFDPNDSYDVVDVVEAVDDAIGAAAGGSVAGSASVAIISVVWGWVAAGGSLAAGWGAAGGVQPARSNPETIRMDRIAGIFLRMDTILSPLSSFCCGF